MSKQCLHTQISIWPLVDDKKFKHTTLALVDLHLTQKHVFVHSVVVVVVVLCSFLPFNFYPFK